MLLWLIAQQDGHKSYPSMITATNRYEVIVTPSDEYRSINPRAAIEGLWGELKTQMRRIYYQQYTPKNQILQFMAEAWWRRNHKNSEEAMRSSLIMILRDRVLTEEDCKTLIAEDCLLPPCLESTLNRQKRRSNTRTVNNEKRRQGIDPQ